MVALEAASFLCIWALIGLCLRSKRYFLIGTSQLAGNSISRVLPGNAGRRGAPIPAAGRGRHGPDPHRDRAHRRVVDQRRHGLRVAAPLGAGDPRRRRGESRAGSSSMARGRSLHPVGRRRRALLLANGPIVWAGRLFQRVRNAVLRKRPPLTGFDERLTRARDVVRATLGERWGQAILRSAGNVLFDYLALARRVGRRRRASEGLARAARRTSRRSSSG